MSEKKVYNVYYCPKCGSTYNRAMPEEDTVFYCPECDEQLYDTGYTKAQWNALSEDAKQQVKENLSLLAKPERHKGAFTYIMRAIDIILVILAILWGSGFMKARGMVKESKASILTMYMTTSSMNPVSEAGFMCYLHNFTDYDNKVSSIQKTLKNY